MRFFLFFEKFISLCFTIIIIIIITYTRTYWKVVVFVVRNDDGRDASRFTSLVGRQFVQTSVDSVDRYD